MKKKILFYHPIFLDGGAEKTNLSISREFSKSYEIIYVSNIFSNKFDKEINELKIKKVCLKNKRTIFSFLEIYNILKDLKPDIIFSVQMHANVLILMINFFLFFNKLKIICCERLSPQSYGNNFKDKFIVTLSKIFYRFSKKIICNSKDLAKEIRNITKTNNVTFIYNPTLRQNFKILAKKFIVKEKPFLLKKVKKIISIGRLDNNKNQLMLLKAFNLLEKNEKQKIKIVLIGEGKNKNLLKNYAKLKNFEENIYFYNFKKNPYPYLYKSDLMVLTSNFEGLPNVLIEAMSLNIPIISTNSPTGPREILLDGKAGFLINKNDYQNLSKKISLFLKFPKAFNKKKIFYKKSLDRFNPKKSLSKYKQIVNSFC